MHAEPRRISLLELLHPDGGAARARVLGGACPAALGPADAAPEGGPADLVVVAPAAGELREGGWLERAAEVAARDVAADGVVVALLPARLRARAGALLRQHGLQLARPLAHVPRGEGNDYLLSLAPASLRHAVGVLMPLHPARRRAALLALRLGHWPGAALRLASDAGVAIVARRPGARPVAHWLFGGTEDGALVMRAKWRGARGVAVVHGIASGATQPTVVAKLALSAGGTAAGTTASGELARLARLGGAARAAGARVPEARALTLGGGRPALVESVVPGEPLSVLLARHPRRLEPALDRVTEWLERWHRETRRVQPLDEARLDRWLLAPAAVLAPSLEDGDAYLAWLRARCARVLGRSVPLVAAHNDLTTSNLLLGAHGELGVVDWEEADAEALPLGDFFYCVTDALTATRRVGGRAVAFDRCFGHAGHYSALATRLGHRLQGAVELPAGVAELSLHACWLRHALNEEAKALPQRGRPFLAIMRALAGRREQLAARGAAGAAPGVPAWPAGEGAPVPGAVSR